MGIWKQPKKMPMYRFYCTNAFALLFGFNCLIETTTAHANPLLIKREVPLYTIQMTLDNFIVTGKLDNSPTVQDFIAQLPLTLELKDYSSTEKIAYLPNTLTTQGAPAGIKPNMGDITYYAPWGNLAIFYQDFSYSRGLIKLGEISHGLEYLRYKGSLKATIKLIDKN